MLRHICVIFLEGLSLHHLPVLQSGIQGQKRTSGRLYLDNRGSKRFWSQSKDLQTCPFGAIKCILKMRVAQECIQRRPAHAKPDFNWLSGPRNGTWKRTCGISCLRSLAPMLRLQCSTTQATFTNPSLLRLLRYSVVCLNSITQCNWHDIETMAE